MLLIKRLPKTNIVFSDKRIEAYFTSLKAENVAESTLVLKTSIFKICKNYLNSKRHKHVTKAAMEEFIVFQRDTKDIKNSTIWLRLLVLKAYLKWNVEELYEKIDPLDTIKNPKPKFIPKAVLLLDEMLETFLPYCEDERDRTILMLYPYTGLRRAEGCRLKWSDFENDFAMVKVQGKGDKEGEGVKIPINDKLRDYLMTVKNGTPHVIANYQFSQRPIAPCIISNNLARISKKAGARVSPHDLRRCFAQSLAAKGVPVNRIQKLMRHKDIQTTMTYLGLTAGQLQESVNAL